jgi:hypothetical protein
MKREPAVASSELRLEVKLPAGKRNDLYPMCRIECAQEEENLVRGEIELRSFLASRRLIGED